MMVDSFRCDERRSVVGAVLRQESKSCNNGNTYAVIVNRSVIKYQFVAPNPNLPCNNQWEIAHSWAGNVLLPPVGPGLSYSSTMPNKAAAKTRADPQPNSLDGVAVKE